MTNVKVGAKNENGDLANPMSKQVQTSRKEIGHLAGIAFGKWPSFNLKDYNDVHLEIRTDVLNDIGYKMLF